MNIYLIALLLYSIFLMALGIVMSRRVKSSTDFLVAGRSLGTGRLFATFLAANIGAGSTVGATGLGYRLGMSAWWWVGSAAIGSLLLSQFLGPKLWVIGKKNGLATLQDFLELRYGKAVKAVIAVLFWFGSLAILAGQLIAISWILNTVAGIPKWQGCVIGGMVAIVYCVAGGMMSSSFVNMFELAVTMSGLLLAVPFALHALGGWGHMRELVLANTGSAARTEQLFSITGAGAKQIAAWFAILVPSFMVSPGLVQKVYGAGDEKTVRGGVVLNSLGQALFAFVPAVLGLCAFAALPHLSNAELALPEAMKTLLPRWLGVWTLASIFSAELSATDAILFMLSTSLAVDLYKTFLNPGVSQQRLLMVSRIILIGAGIAGILLAAILPSIIAAVSIFYGLIAVSLFVPVLAGLYSRRVLSAAALSSIFAALAATLVTMRLTHGVGFGVLSPQAIGILTAAIVMVAFRVFAPVSPKPADSPPAKGAVL
ncbi:sodium:solute symporter family protein [Edaphobacter aggregans]|uniref:sodium:solute symporter family protein n=1 Tax=Edaphobacter aggregans TaxID=570835 RepID=UPI0006921184|nr:sodium:solute symporter family protein [Edaphobacter aggregans]